MDADRQALVAGLRSPGFGDWFKNQFSLDPQPDQDFLSPQTAGDFALSMIPGVGQAMALRDMERARRAEDPVAGAAAAAGLLPFGKLAGALKNKVVVARNAPGEIAQRSMDEADKLFKEGGNVHEIFQQSGGGFKAPDNQTKYWVPDKEAVFMDKALQQAGDDAYTGSLAGALRHPKLYAADPSLKDIQVELSLARPGKDVKLGGGYYSGSDRFQVGAQNTDELMDFVLHETSHGGQARAVKAGIPVSEGANLDLIENVLRTQYPKSSQHWIEKTAKRMYLDNTGEVEARIPGNVLRVPKWEGYSTSSIYRPQEGGMLWSEKSPKYRDFDVDVFNAEQAKKYAEELRRRKMGLGP